MNKTITYKNHTFENGVMLKGPRTRKVIKPNSKGIYKLSCKGVTEHLTIDDIIRGKKEVETVPIEPIPIGKFNPSIVIDLHMQGKSTMEISKEVGRTTRTITSIKSKFIGISRFETICTNFNISGHQIKKAYGIKCSISEYDSDDKLRLISRYIRDHSRANNLSREEMCGNRGYNYRAMSGWNKYNGFTVNDETMAECMNRYESTLEERNLKNGIKNDF